MVQHTYHTLIYRVRKKYSLWRTILAKDASVQTIITNVDNLPTLSEIEASTLAKEATVDETLKAAKLAAALSA
jgi:hypothetical protein